MPLPINLNSSIERAVTSVLEKEGIYTKIEEFDKALDAQGISVNELASQLAMLIYSGKERTKLEAIKMALAGKGIDLREKDPVTQAPTIIFQINSSTEQTLNMFAPPREIKSLEEMSKPLCQ